MIAVAAIMASGSFILCCLRMSAVLSLIGRSSSFLAVLKSTMILAFRLRNFRLMQQWLPGDDSGVSIDRREIWSWLLPDITNCHLHKRRQF